MPKKEETNSRTPEIFKEIPSFNENNKVIYLFDQNTGRYQYMSSGINNLAGFAQNIMKIVKLLRNLVQLI